MLRYFCEQLLTFKLWSNFLTPEFIHGFRLTDRQKTVQNIELGIRPSWKFWIGSSLEILHMQYILFTYIHTSSILENFLQYVVKIMWWCAPTRQGRPPLHYVARHTNYLEVRPLVNPGQLGHFMSQREYGCLIFMLLWLFPENIHFMHRAYTMQHNDDVG